MRVPVIEHLLTWHRVVSPPWAAIRNATGMVNAAGFLGAAAETVLFDGATAKKQFLGIDGTGLATFGWRLTYTFREKTIKTPARPGRLEPRLPSAAAEQPGLGQAARRRRRNALSHGRFRRAVCGGSE